MGGLDKYNAMKELIAQGWEEVPEVGRHILRPPRSLIERLATMTFHVYDARDLHAISRPPSNDDPAPEVPTEGGQ